MRFRVILNRFVGFGYAELKVLPRRGTTKEHILLYRTHVFIGVNLCSFGFAELKVVDCFVSTELSENRNLILHSSFFILHFIFFGDNL